MGGSLSRGADIPVKEGHLASRMRDLPFSAAVPGVRADCDGLLVESSCCTGGLHHCISSSAFFGTWFRGAGSQGYSRPLMRFAALARAKRDPNLGTEQLGVVGCRLDDIRGSGHGGD